MHSGPYACAKAHGWRLCGTTWVTRISRDPNVHKSGWEELSKGAHRHIPWLPAFAIALSVQNA